jgi:glycine cleavage system aminomethyltransferase T
VLIVDRDGGIVNDPVLLRLGENHFWLAIADSDVLLFARGIAALSDLDVEIREPDVSPLQIQGPRSKDVVRDLFGPDILDLRYYWFTRTEVDGIPVIVTRTGWTSEVGYEVYLLDPERGVDLWGRIMEAGRPHQIRPTGPSDIRRIEGGIFNYRADMDWTTNPYELGLDRLVDLDMDAEFMGKDALRRIRDRGVDRKMVGVEIAGDRLEMNEIPWPVDSDGRRVGTVTSAIYSPRLQRNIGFAWVPVELSDLGSGLSVETADGRRDATVVRMPFVDPGKQIPKS